MFRSYICHDLKNELGNSYCDHNNLFIYLFIYLQDFHQIKKNYNNKNNDATQVRDTQQS